MENPDDPTGAPPNLPFLEILYEFTNKLLKQDKKVVLDYLDKRIGTGMPSRYLNSSLLRVLVFFNAPDFLVIFFSMFKNV